MFVQEAVVLVGSGEDPEGASLGYQWSVVERPEGSTSALEDVSVPSTRFVVDRPGRYVVQLVVDDGLQSSLPDFVEIRTIDRDTVVDAGPDLMVELGVQVVLQGSVSDPDGDPVSVEWSVVSGPAQLELRDAGTVSPSFSASVAGIYDVELAASTAARTVRDVVRIRAGVENRAPVAVAGEDVLATLGGQVVLDGGGSFDPDGDPLTYTWALWESPPGSTVEVERVRTTTVGFVADAIGTYVLELSVSDGLVESAPDLVYVVVEASEESADVFDPGEVYIIGSLYPGSRGSLAIGHWATASMRAVVGFDSTLRLNGVVIEPRRRRLLLSNSIDSLLREFHCDEACEVRAGEAWSYPETPMANDPALPVFRCGASRYIFDLEVWPEGGYLYSCSSGWYERTTRFEVLAGQDVLALGQHRRALTAADDVYAVVDTETASVAPVRGLPPEAMVLGARARVDSGFWLAILVQEELQLWSIDERGVAVAVLTYGPAPEHFEPFAEARLDAAQNLFVVGYGELGWYVVMRYARDGTTTKVHDDESGFLYLLRPALVTGP